MDAVGMWLEKNKAPGRKVKELDNRGSNYYLALFWAECLAAKDSSWQSLANKLKGAEEEIIKELVECQGSNVNIGGYYHPDPVKTETVMRPSKKFNELMDNLDSAL